jgi:hypothetical protein
VARAVLRFLDDDGEAVVLDPTDADALWRMTAGLEAATVSACPRCRSRVVAVVALVDLLESSTEPYAVDLVELADDAPTLHLYVVDDSGCRHDDWLDPGHEEWEDAVAPSAGPLRRPAP